MVVRTCGIRGLPLEAWDVKCLDHVVTYHLQRLDSVRLELDAQEELNRHTLQFLVATALTLEAANTVLCTVGRDLRSASFGKMVDTLSATYAAQVERLDWSAGDAFAVVSATAGATVRNMEPRTVKVLDLQLLQLGCCRKCSCCCNTSCR